MSVPRESATVCHTVDVSIRELRNHTRRVIAAVESGVPVVLTSHGRPIADIVPRVQRSERRSTEAVMASLARISEVWRESGSVSDPSDFDLDFGYTTDDVLANLGYPDDDDPPASS